MDPCTTWSWTVQASRSKVMAKHPENIAEATPDQKPPTGSHASRLASLTGLNRKEPAGISVAQIGERFRWKIDLEILPLRRICGDGIHSEVVEDYREFNVQVLSTTTKTIPRLHSLFTCMRLLRGAVANPVLDRGRP